LDEVDIHLHPEWQWKVLPFVQRLFPNSQIFASTHSPFVVSSSNGAWIHPLCIGENRDDSHSATDLPRLAPAKSGVIDFVRWQSSTDCPSRADDQAGRIGVVVDADMAFYLYLNYISGRGSIQADCYAEA
jgi:hypothetical protein